MIVFHLTETSVFPPIAYNNNYLSFLNVGARSVERSNGRIL
jgi:hypothetical protein